jgi:thioredoxin-related protein
MVKAFMVAALLLAGVSVASAAEIGGDGLHKEDWFSLSFRDIREDMDTARAEGKGLVLVFEQRGCIYCAKMHEEILSDGEVRDFIRSNFKVVQYNLFGSEEVTDLDGKSLVEKTAARRWNVVFTPTIIFLPETAPDDVTVAQAAVATMPGAFGKQTFLHMFQWVHEKGYATDEHFQKYHARKLDEMRAQGANPGE